RNHSLLPRTARLFYADARKAGRGDSFAAFNFGYNHRTLYRIFARGTARKIFDGSDLLARGSGVLKLGGRSRRNRGVTDERHYDISAESVRSRNVYARSI